MQKTFEETINWIRFDLIMSDNIGLLSTNVIYTLELKNRTNET